MRKIHLTASAADAGVRLDKFLSARSGLSRGQCRRAIAEGGVWLSGRRILRLSRPVERGETFALVLDEPRPEGPEPAILYEDRWLLALDKPAGLPTGGTLASRAANALAWAGRHAGRECLSVHRLDAGTSGVLVVAKNREAASRLAATFRDGLARKLYLALAYGHLPAARGTVEAPLGRAATPGRWQAVSTGGLAARTDWEVRASSGSVFWLAVRPRTGRTHQIRVHLAHAGAPIVGDRRYGGLATVPLPGGGAFVAARPLLHAARLELPHPATGEPLTLAASPPADLSEVLVAFGWSGSG